MLVQLMARSMYLRRMIMNHRLSSWIINDHHQDDFLTISWWFDDHNHQWSRTWEASCQQASRWLGTTHDPRGSVAEGDSLALAQAVQVAERECGNWVKLWYASQLADGSDLLAMISMPKIQQGDLGILVLHPVDLRIISWQRNWSSKLVEAAASEAKMTLLRLQQPRPQPKLHCRRRKR